MSTAVAGLFDERAAAERAIAELIESGYPGDTISLVTADPGVEPGTTYHIGNQGAQGAATGATAGFILGGLFGLLVGATVIAVPGAGLLAAGPIAGFFTGALAGAATGGLVGGLVGLGIPEAHAAVMAEGIRRGGVLVTVQCPGDLAIQAERILRAHGAIDIEQRREYYVSEGWSGYEVGSQQYTTEEIARERASLASRGFAVAPVAPHLVDTSQPPDTDRASTVAEIGSMEPFFRSDYLSRFGSEAGSYESFAPAYRWGFQASSSSLYASTEWHAIEPNIRAEWERSNPGTWDQFSGAIRYAWDRARTRTITGPELI